ncbi:MAG TPA: hypothetical protein VNH18_33170 [Bryobacteraceae bacterium]|nr:hypothetical protein [Bryobacteraceae bacterium]
MTTSHVALVSDTPSIGFEGVSNVSAAIQKQVTRDFGPLWNVNATVDAFPTLEAVPVDYWPVIIRDDINEPGAAGFHTDKNGQPFALVQADITWGLTVSHETLEMLADPFGNRTIAGSPPPQATGPAKKLARVLYLVEVCDPPEDESFAYQSNGVLVSDFITPHYYDPTLSASVRYSFGGNVKAPHQVLKNGYVSFGDPATNHWYQVLVQKGKAVTKSLGILNTAGRSLRETIDHESRKARPGYRTGKPITKARAATVGDKPVRAATAGRAEILRSYIETLRGQ